MDVVDVGTGTAMRGRKLHTHQNILTCVLEAKDLQTTGVELKVLRRTRLRVRNSAEEEEGERGGWQSHGGG